MNLPTELDILVIIFPFILAIIIAIIGGVLTLLEAIYKLIRNEVELWRDVK